jgi:hypothetical protein
MCTEICPMYVDYSFSVQYNLVRGLGDCLNVPAEFCRFDQLNKIYELQHSLALIGRLTGLAAVEALQCIYLARSTRDDVDPLQNIQASLSNLFVRVHQSDQ